MKRIATLSATIVALSAPLHANEMAATMQTYLETNIATWANDPVLVAAIRAQNAETAGYDQSRIDEMDQMWRGFAGSADADIIADVINNPAAEFLRVQVANSGGAITEAFVVDALGLNVAASAPTSDYWQGDEEKFTRTFTVGPGAVHFGEVELDDSTQEVQSQVSVTIIDTETGEPVGALTVGINVTALM